MHSNEGPKDCVKIEKERQNVFIINVCALGISIGHF